MPHFEIQVADMDAAKTFYSGLFGWTITPMPGGEHMNYHLISGKGFEPETGLTGGIFPRNTETPASGSGIRGGMMTFDVADCDKSYAWALDNGGAEAMPPTDMPGIGRCACVEDGQGNIVGMITPEGDA